MAGMMWKYEIMGKRAVNPPIQEGGGLSSLRKRLEQDGATMSYRYNGAVTLILTIPKE